MLQWLTPERFVPYSKSDATGMLFVLQRRSEPRYRLLLLNSTKPEDRRVPVDYTIAVSDIVDAHLEPMPQEALPDAQELTLYVRQGCVYQFFFHMKKDAEAIYQAVEAVRNRCAPGSQTSE